MIRRTATLVLALALIALGGQGLSRADAAPAPAAGWKLALTSMPTNFAPGASSQYLLVATNVGAAPTSGPITLKATVPALLNVLKARTALGGPGAPPPPDCTIAANEVTCATEGQATETVQPGRIIVASIDVSVPPGAAEQTLLAEGSIEGGGALQAVSTATPTPIGPDPVPFGFLPGFGAPLTNEDGLPATAAGAHPNQLTVDLGFPSERLGNNLTGAGHPRDITAELPRGLLGNPAAIPVLCTEAELTSENCPDESQVGLVTITTGIEVGVAILPTSNLYSMVPPPGSVASFGTNAVGIGIFIHLLAGVRSDGDYRAYATTEDVLALGPNPLFNIQTQLWGDPSSPIHNNTRGNCLFTGASDPCKVPQRETPFLTMPGDCSDEPLGFRALADSWQQPGLFYEASYQSADLAGNPVSVSGCNALEFEPKISVLPTNSLADSPTGLEVSLHQPQEPPHSEPLNGRATAILKDATVTLPAGMAANASQADGLAACSRSQIGLTTEIGHAPIHFDEQPATCPEAAKLGTVEVTSPLLAEYDAEHRLATDPETGAPLLRPLRGSVYLAEPFDNPFDSLLAIYLAVEDPRTGIVAKLAGEVEPDPQSGQLTTRFAENPELPLEDVTLELFKGARAPLITPPTCGTHTTTTDLLPWAAPEAPTAHPTSSFQTTAAPGGGSCPAIEGQAPNAPSFSAGTVSPQAGAYSPFVLKLSRDDGSQRLTGFDTVLPPGLTGRLAGIPACSEAALAQAASRSNPEQGILERQSPSCPAASALGTVTVGAGAGPTPFHTQGTAYLAGPYKGAPLSMAVITPAIAGPFDLGTVLVRAALYLDRDSAQIHAVSDPFPTILHGIPLDLRSVAVKLDRPSFTLNPTSCDPMAIAGTATSILGQAAPLISSFQVGGCPELGFKPKLSLQLKGKTKRTSHPRLIANLRGRPGDANIARAQVKLPKAAFLDQAHIGTVCTRVQFAAKACPPGSIYGTVWATTPLLDYKLTGNVYLRSSSNLLPDLIADLNGPAAQPLEIAIAGRTDSVKGALRNTFEAVPDQPVTQFHLELFGGKRGLIELSSGLCANPKAQVQMDGQNGKTYDTNPVVKTSCPKKHKKRHKQHKRRTHR